MKSNLTSLALIPATVAVLANDTAHFAAQEQHAHTVIQSGSREKEGSVPPSVEPSNIPGMPPLFRNVIANQRLDLKIKEIQNTLANVEVCGAGLEARTIVAIGEISSEQKTLLVPEYTMKAAKCVQDQIKSIIDILDPEAIFVSGLTSVECERRNAQLVSIRKLEAESYQHQLLFGDRTEEELTQLIERWAKYFPESKSIEMLQYLQTRDFLLGRLSKSGVQQAALSREMVLQAAESDELFVELYRLSNSPERQKFEELFARRDAEILRRIDVSGQAVSFVCMEASRSLKDEVIAWNVTHESAPFRLVQMMPLELPRSVGSE